MTGESVTAEYIAGISDARQLMSASLPDWPRYVATPYGTIWCVNTGARGRGAGAPFIVSEFYHRNKRHVNLSNKFGMRRRQSVKRLIDLTWGSDSEFREN
jgi:hypothetical protein